ncbi:MAG: hypothetical protein ACI85Q_001548, partial [Salibacteraceae bacterium]
MKWNVFLLILVSLTVFNVDGLAQKNKRYSFDRLYSNIFDLNCYSSGCHDGSFEPNFTSMNNAYYTLVYHPVKKNNEEASFTYRVEPGNPKNSLLYERITNCCFLDIDDRMPLLSKYLSKKEIRLIKKWIEAGAPDWK